MRYLAVLSLVLFGLVTVHAQGTCPDVDQVLAPLDTGAFRIVQDYGVRSPRHDGRYHTGEDWALVDAASRGQPVRAVANGTVTFAYDRAWGRDGGVVILEHRMPDESVVYSVYGHLIETADSPFPPGNACVSEGDVIGLIGDARPAPHLHFEIRVNNGRSPGQGYSWDYPSEAGYRRPSRFLDNWRAELNRTVRWVTNLNREGGYNSPPQPLSDNSLLIANGAQVTRILPDGRQLWRKTYEQQVVAVRGFQGNTFAYFADGLVQQINPVDGTLGEFWRINAPLVGAPFVLDEALVFPSPTGGLLAVDVRQREIVWEAANIPVFTQAWVGSQTIGLQTTDNQLVTLSRSNRNVLDTAALNNQSGVIINTEGRLMVYSQGGLWQVLADGVWQTVEYDVSLPQEHGAVSLTSNGDLLVFDGTTVRSYARNGVQQWAFEVPGVTGRAVLAELDGRALLYSADGTIAAVSPLGKVCQVRVWGKPDDYLWHTLGDDGVLRVMIGGSVAGIDWTRFSRDCA